MSLKHFFTGQPCKHDHICERNVANGSCVECTRVSALAYRNRNIEQHRAAAAAWIKGNAGRRLEWAKQWRADNPEKIKAASKKHRLANREKVVAQQTRWRKLNQEKFKAGRAKYRAGNMDKILVHCRRRRARKMGVAGSHTAADVAALLAAQGCKCAWCRTDLRRTKQHVDHIQPLSKGGHDGKQNLQVLCATCNTRKWAFDPIEFARRIGRLL